jgi:hypothetical protein
MKKSERKGDEKYKSLEQTAKRRIYVHLVVLVLLTVGVFAAMGFVISPSKYAGAQSTKPPAAKEFVAKPDSMVGFKSLKGRWMRPDGGYVLEIRDVDAIGKMTAAYFNPRPINVSQAEAALDGTTIKVFIELRDVNYPGATYHLTYDQEGDQLRGVYFQPALQQKFDVFFVRVK